MKMPRQKCHNCQSPLPLFKSKETTCQGCGAGYVRVDTKFTRIVNALHGGAVFLFIAFFFLSSLPFWFKIFVLTSLIFLALLLPFFATRWHEKP